MAAVSLENVANLLSGFIDTIVDEKPKELAMFVTRVNHAHRSEAVAKAITRINDGIDELLNDLTNVLTTKTLNDVKFYEEVVRASLSRFSEGYTHRNITRSITKSFIRKGLTKPKASGDWGVYEKEILDGIQTGIDKLNAVLGMIGGERIHSRGPTLRIRKVRKYRRARQCVRCGDTITHTRRIHH